MKAVLISIRPRWCEKILSGVKTVEVRKTRPKLKTPFRCYIYKTLPKSGDWNDTGGKIIGEFVCDNITSLHNVCTDDWANLIGGLHRIEKDLVDQACLTEAQLHTYAGGRNCFAWRISDLRIYDQPRKLEEFAGIRTMRNGFELRLLDRPPQSWCYVAEGQR